MRLRGFVLLVFFVYGMMATNDGWADSLSVANFRNQPSPDTYVVEIAIDGASYRIPRNYLLDAVFEPDGRAYFIAIAFLPSLSGVSGNEGRCAKVQTWTTCDNLLVIFSHGIRGVRSFYEAAFSVARREADQQFRFGLQTFRGRSPLMPAQYYVHEGSTLKESIVIACPLPSEHLRFCTYNVEVAGGREIAVHFSEKYLPEWKRLLGTQDLFENFYVQGSRRPSN